VDDWFRRIALAIIVPCNLVVRGGQLWLWWQGLKILWTGGLEGNWLGGMLGFVIFTGISGLVSGLMLSLPRELEDKPRMRKRD
jgi:hypothetical protein